MENLNIIPPPERLISSNPLDWLRFFGPGAIIASITIGSGETLFCSREGSIFGYQILWVFLWITLFKWVLVYSSMRHMILSGGHPFVRWSVFPGPCGWFPLFMFLVAIICFPFWTSFILGLLGTICTWIFGFGDLYFWATASTCVVVVLWIAGSYQILEKAQVVTVLIMLICILIAMFYVRPNWFAVAEGILIPQPLAYPDWVFSILPELKNRSAWVEIVVAASAIGGASFDYLAYVSFVREKKWGLSHLGVADPDLLNTIAEQSNHPVRIWLRAAKIDTIISFSLVVFFSVCFTVLGTIILQPRQLIPEGVNLLNYQANFLTELSQWLLPLYKIGIFCTFFGMIYAGPEMNFQIIYEYLNSLAITHGRLPRRKLRVGIVSWCFGGGLIILWTSRYYPSVQLIDIVTPAAFYSGIISCGFYCLTNPWMDRRFLPASLRMPRWMAALNILAGIIFWGMGIKALWDYGRYKSFIMLAGFILVCFLLASRLRLLRPVPSHPLKTSDE
jgi:hypothetical protein